MVIIVFVLLVLDTESSTWFSMRPMHHARTFRASATVLNGCIYVAGGGINYSAQNTVESYDPASDTWTLLASMNRFRSEFALFESNGFLYAIGGNRSVEKYDPSKNEWTEVRSTLK